MRYYVLSRAGKSLVDGEFFFSTRGIYESFTLADQAARKLWRLDEHAARECSEGMMFMIEEHRLARHVPRVDRDNRLAPLRKWYWVPTKEAHFFPMEDVKGALEP